MNEKLMQIMEKRINGISMEEILQQDLEMTEKEIEEYKKVKEDITKTVKETEKSFQDMKMQDAIIQEIDNQCKDDLDRQFKIISYLKYHFVIRDFLASKEALENPEFYEETIKEIYEKEQQMEDVTIEELEQLREELISIIADDGIGNIFEIFPEHNEEVTSILEKVKKEMEEFPQDIKDDMIIMIAALYQKEHPEISKEQALGETMFISESKLTALSNFVWVAIPKTLNFMSCGIVTFIFGGLSGLDPLVGLGLCITGISGAIIAGLTVSGVGLIGYESIKRLIPFLKNTWKTVSPFVKKCANKVKLVIASAIGIVTNKVLKPVIAFATNTAIPIICEKVYYPLKRRLEYIMDWIIEKKNQFIDFIKEASNKNSQTEENSEESSSVTFTFNKQNENEPIMAN